MDERFSNDTLFAEQLAEMLSDAVAQAVDAREIRLIVNGKELGSVAAQEGRAAVGRMEREIALRRGVK